MSARNFQHELEEVIRDAAETGQRPTLLLHACCAPCSSYVLEYLEDAFRILLYPYNPNITEEGEYRHRVEEMQRLCRELPKEEVPVIPASYEPETFLAAVGGLEEEEEGGARCAVCFELRLRAAAKEALRVGADWFTTTLSISPRKNAALLNEIGERVGEEIGVRYLPSDFKKNDGYLRSVELSKEYGLYRQNYCGCVFSKNER